MKKGSPRIRKPDVHFRLTTEQHKYLQAAAKAQDRSVSYLIAQIVGEWIEKSKLKTGG